MKAIGTRSFPKCRSFLFGLALLLISSQQGFAQNMASGIFYSGFEINQPTFVYGAASGYTLPAPGPNGPRSGSYAGGVAGSSMGYKASIVTAQKFTLQPNTQYVIEVHAKVTNGLGTLTLVKSSGTGYQQVVSSAGAEANRLVTVSIANTEHSTPISHQFTVLQTEEVHLALLFDSNNNHSVYVDDISISAACNLQAGAISGSVEICGGPAPERLLVLSNYTGEVQKWQSSTNSGQTWQDIAHTEETYFSPVVSTTTQFRAVLTGGSTSSCQAFSNPATIAVTSGDIQVAVTASATTICAGTPVTFTASSANAGLYPVYQWRVNGTLVGQGSSFTSSSLPNNAQVTATVRSRSTCFNETTKVSAPVTVTVNANTTTIWRGFTTNWFDSGNWSACVPTAETNAEIPTLAAGRVAPVITAQAGTFAQVKNLTSLAIVTLASSARLEINGSFSGQGTISGDPASTVVVRGLALQVPAGTYGQLVLEGFSEQTRLKSLTGPVLVTTSLNLAAGSLQLGNHTLTAANGGVLAAYNSAHYIIQNGTGRLQINNIGNGWAGVFPVGTPGNYTPATLTNMGTLDSYSLRVVDEMRASGLQGTTYSTQVVRKTWDISEGTPGGSSVNLELQWNLEDEASGFERFQSFISQYSPEGTWVRLATIPRGARQVGAGRYSLSQSGVTSFSLFAVGSGDALPLPVALSRFEVRKQETDALLTWETASEKNNKGFEVQVSTDGATFRALGFVASKSPNSQAKQTYSFVDSEEGKSGTLYYRLRQLDLDGTATLSPVRAVSFEAQVQARVQAFPNPFREELTVEVHAPLDNQATLVVTDPVGRVVHAQDLVLLKGSNRVPIRLDARHPQGLYLLSVRYNGGTFQAKLIKRK